MLRLLDAKNWLIGKDPDDGIDWRQEEKGMRGWGGWMASLTRWTWVWVNSGSWWWTVLQSMGSQRFKHDWETELNWTVLKNIKHRHIQRKEGRVKRGRTAVMQLQIQQCQGCQQPAETGKRREGLFPGTSEQTRPWEHFAFRFLASRNLREQISLGLNQAVCGNLL